MKKISISILLFISIFPLFGVDSKYIQLDTSNLGHYFTSLFLINRLFCCNPLPVISYFFLDDYSVNYYLIIGSVHTPEE
ncbi:MAG: hypothetical protein MJB14_03810 [Spirochaetes bacterium]|nr:hypothetical protein [Spirochaetota bacterium]